MFPSEAYERWKAQAYKTRLTESGAAIVAHAIELKQMRDDTEALADHCLKLVAAVRELKEAQQRVEQVRGSELSEVSFEELAAEFKRRQVALREAEESLFRLAGVSTDGE